jgi:hypothetical protein
MAVSVDQEQENRDGTSGPVSAKGVMKAFRTWQPWMAMVVSGRPRGAAVRMF